jgi:hypothetical protein
MRVYRKFILCFLLTLKVVQGQTEKEPELQDQGQKLIEMWTRQQRRRKKSQSEYVKNSLKLGYGQTKN